MKNLLSFPGCVTLASGFPLQGEGLSFSICEMVLGFFCSGWGSSSELLFVLENPTSCALSSRLGSSVPILLSSLALMAQDLEHLYPDLSPLLGGQAWG